METGIFHSATEVSAWADGQHCWLCVKVILLKQNKRNVSTLDPKYLFMKEAIVCFHLQRKDVWLSI